jgi:hypothetical protein
MHGTVMHAQSVCAQSFLRSGLTTRAGVLPPHRSACASASRNGVHPPPSILQRQHVDCLIPATCQNTSTCRGSGETFCPLKLLSALFPRCGVAHGSSWLHQCQILVDAYSLIMVQQTAVSAQLPMYRSKHVSCVYHPLCCS